MKKIAFMLFMAGAFSGAAQTAFVSSGVITFERSINSYAVTPLVMQAARKMKETEVAAFMQRFRSREKQFQTDDFNLYFDRTQSLYQPAVPEGKPPFYMPAAYKNRVYNNLEKKESIAEKQVFEKLFYVKDSAMRIRWKITEEVRDIAGFQCRRANALVSDSVYVVAFYTDEILAQSGPESFTGLPGMILGVALPRLHITYFAKSVRATETSPAELKIPKPGKKNSPLSRKEFISVTAKSLGANRIMTSGWGKNFLYL